MFWSLVSKPLTLRHILRAEDNQQPVTIPKPLNPKPNTYAQKEQCQRAVHAETNLICLPILFLGALRVLNYG